MFKKIVPLVLMAGAAHAAGHNGPYVGAGVGAISFEGGEDIGLSIKNTGTAFKLFGGYQINRNLAVEGTYIDSGSPKDNVDGVTFTLDATAFEASIRGIVPFSDAVSGYARAGIIAWKATGTVSNGFDSASADDDGTNFGWGAGVQFQLSLNIQGRVEYEGAKISDLDYRLASAGIVWLFK
jgi:OOP family OmpA-OmpF porin